MLAWVDTQIDTVNEVREWFANNLEIEIKGLTNWDKMKPIKGWEQPLRPLRLLTIRLSMPTLEILRIGLIRGEEYHQLTSDHSLVNELLKAGQLTPEEAANHPQKKYYYPVSRSKR